METVKAIPHSVKLKITTTAQGFPQEQGSVSSGIGNITSKKQQRGIRTKLDRQPTHVI